MRQRDLLARSHLNDAFAVRGSIRAATSRNINRVLIHVVDHQSNPALGFEPGPTDYKSKKHIALPQIGNLDYRSICLRFCRSDSTSRILLDVAESGA